MLYATGFVFVIAFVVIFTAKKTTILNPTTANTANSNDLSGTAQAPATNTPSYQDPTSPNAQPMITDSEQNTQQSKNLSEAARVQQIEIAKTKELNLKNVKLIREKILQEELTSLQNSIQNDEKLLKEIEAEGTEANDYRYIENNLKKRRARLKQLTEK